MGFAGHQVAVEAPRASGRESGADRRAFGHPGGAQVGSVDLQSYAAKVAEPPGDGLGRPEGGDERRLLGRAAGERRVDLGGPLGACQPSRHLGETVRERGGETRLLAVEAKAIEE